MIRVYIAGPYTKGDVEQNVRVAIEAGEAVAKLGHHPFIPHLSHFWDKLFPRPYEFWIKWDNEWLAACDILLRIPGESPGADAEVRLANKLKIPVVYSIDDIEGKL